MNTIRDSRALWLAQQVCPHEPALRRWLASRLGHGGQIDDVIQEAYAKLATLPSVDHVENPRAYFFRTALSCALTEMRRPAQSFDPLSEIHSHEIESNDVPVDVQAELRQELRLVAKAIDQLPPRCREVFVMRRVHGLSQREIAQRLGLSENTVEKHVSRGIRQLNIFLGRGGKPDPLESKAQMPDAGPYVEPRDEQPD